jgi:putative DNA methylase
MGARLMAVVVDGPAGRVYLSPTKEIESIAQVALPEDVPHAPIEHWAGCTNCVIYGLESFEKLFSPRQLTAMLCFSDLLPKVAQMVHMDWVAIEKKEAGAMDFEQYSSSLSILLAMAVDKGADYWSTMCTWDNTREGIGHTFGRQAIPMSWDYAETNLFSESSGNWSGILDWVYKALVHLPAKGKGIAIQHDAATPAPFCKAAIISTDPPYYDNVPYSNISDYFYVWLRRGLRTILPELFSTIAVPKQPELVANQFRHGGKANAHKFFMAGMQTAMEHMAKESHPTVPVTIYYAFKQAETKEGATTSTGWETFLEAVIAAGFAVLGTWPMRTELTNRRMGAGNNVLASSVVLVCRPRAVTASTISRREFIRELNVELPLALDSMTRESEDLPSPVAPVDLSQAIIGPGMAVFSKYSAVLEADGTPMTVRTALQLINRFLAEDDFDADTQFCLHWFEQYGWETGKFGEADTLARAKGTSVDGVKNAGVLYSAGGDVRLLKWGEYPNEWDPKSDQRLPIWEVLHQLIRVFNTDGESGAAAVFASVQSKAEAARQLAYRLYTLCERKNWAEDARAYNEVVTSWSGIESAAAKEPAMKQGELF